MSRAEPMAVVICVPVRDEARNLPALFSTLATQRPVRQTVCVAMVFDGCRDESRSVAIQSARAHRMDIHIECLPIAAPSAGRARGAALALGRNLVGTTGVLLTTDADTRPNADWVARSIAAMQDADFVCGYIGRRRGMAEGARQEIEGYLDRLHKVHRTIDPVEGDAAPSHWHEGGASLGMTARAWDLIGDEPLEASGEDRQLVRRARLAGLRVRQDPRVRVRTSSRMRGRASGGLADALRHGRAEHAAGILPSMEHPDDVVARFERAAVARAAFPAIDGLADRIGVAPVIVARTATAARSADAFVTALPLVRGPHRVLPLPAASHVLRAHEAAVA